MGWRADWGDRDNAARRGGMIVCARRGGGSKRGQGRNGVRNRIAQPIRTDSRGLAGSFQPRREVFDSTKFFSILAEAFCARKSSFSTSPELFALGRVLFRSRRNYSRSKKFFSVLAGTIRARKSSFSTSPELFALKKVLFLLKPSRAAFDRDGGGCGIFGTGHRKGDSPASAL